MLCPNKSNHTVQLSSTNWKPGKGLNTGLWTCLLCHDLRWRSTSHARRHEKTAAHQSAVLVKSWQPIPSENAQSASHGTPAAADRATGPPGQILLDFAQSSKSSGPARLSEASDPGPPPPGGMSGMLELGSISFNGKFAPPPDQVVISRMPESLDRWLKESSVGSSMGAGLDESSSGKSFRSPDDMRSLTRYVRCYSSLRRRSR